jgi:hypothetical protein
MVRLPGAWRALFGDRPAAAQSPFATEAGVGVPKHRLWLGCGFPVATSGSCTSAMRLTSRSSTAPISTLGVGGTFRGHDGQLKMVEALNAWERWEVPPAIVLELFPASARPPGAG